MEGYVLIHKRIIHWEWYSDPNTCRLFLHLILKANYNDKSWRGIHIKRGQLITSVNHLSAELELSIQQIKTSLEKLITTKEIRKQSTNKYTRLTVVGYEEYQDGSLANNKQNNNQFNKPKINKKSSNSLQIITTKEKKEIEKEKENDKIDKATNFLKMDILFWEKFENNFKEKIIEFETMLESFNFKVIEEEVKFKKEILEARINRYALSWAKNQKSKVLIKPNFDKNR